MLVKIAGVFIVAPAFLAPFVALATLGGYIGNTYTTAELPVRREQSNAKAPVLGHFSAAIGGLSNIFIVRRPIHADEPCHSIHSGVRRSGCLPARVT
jgi:hypothetical protein